jgi:hypothetical protein
MEWLIVVLCVLLIVLLLRTASGYTITVNGETLNANGYSVSSGTTRTAVGDPFMTADSNTCSQGCTTGCDYWEWMSATKMCQKYQIAAVDKPVTEVGYKVTPGQPDLRYGAVAKAQGCLDACTADPKCLGWIHYNENADEAMRGQCTLISALPNGNNDFRGFK